jgi:hypothetical protein
MIARIFRHDYGFAFLGALDTPPERPLATLDAETLELTPDFVPLVPATFNAETLLFNPTYFPVFVVFILFNFI